MNIKIDILAFGAHPDDVEMGCGGTLLLHIANGKKAGICDLTRGELGTRGTAAIRKSEAKKAADVLGVLFRENLGFKDGFFTNDKKHQLAIIKIIRKYKPEIVLTNAPSDRHPDHGRASHIIAEACFLSGLVKIKTKNGKKFQDAWRPKLILQYLQFYPLRPDILVDISTVIEPKVKAIESYRSQFYNPQSNEPETVLTSPDFVEMIKARARLLGRQIGAQYAEGFISTRQLGVKNLFDLI